MIEPNDALDALVAHHGSDRKAAAAIGIPQPSFSRYRRKDADSMRIGTYRVIIREFERIQDLPSETDTAA